jgi:hypothetical protein
MAEQRERGRVRPVEVLEHEQDRAARGHAGEQVVDGGVQPVPLGVGVGGDGRRQLAHPQRQLRQHPGQLPAGGAEVGAQGRRLDEAGQLVERVRERLVGRPHDGVAGAVEDERALAGRFMRELPREAALPRARVAAEQRGAPAFARGAGQQRAQGGELARAADERQRRRRAERARERRRVHAATSQN